MRVDFDVPQRRLSHHMYCSIMWRVRRGDGDRWKWQPLSLESVTLVGGAGDGDPRGSHIVRVAFPSLVWCRQMKLSAGYHSKPTLCWDWNHRSPAL